MKKAVILNYKGALEDIDVDTNVLKNKYGIIVEELIPGMVWVYGVDGFVEELSKTDLSEKWEVLETKQYSNPKPL